MSRRNKKHKIQTPQIVSVPCSNYMTHAGKNVIINLPVPKPEVIIAMKAEHNDLVLSQYFNAVKDIAKMESETLYKCACKKYSFIWKVIAVFAALTFLILGMVLGYKINPTWGSFRLNVDPIDKNK